MAQPEGTKREQAKISPGFRILTASSAKDSVQVKDSRKSTKGSKL